MSWAILVVGALTTALASGGIARWASNPTRPATWASRLTLHPAGLLRRCLVGIGLLAATMVLLVGLGLTTRVTEPWIDQPVFDFFGRHQAPALTSAMQVLTLMGNRQQTRLVAVVGAVLLPLLWRRLRWLPPVLVLGMVVVERYGQLVLARLVDRGHPPTTLGTWPSGGCARLICIYGTILLLVQLGLRQRRDRALPGWAGATAWTVLAVAAWVEAFSRTYLLKHWVTDVGGGLIFGALLLLVPAYLVSPLSADPAEPRRRGSHRAPSRV